MTSADTTSADPMGAAPSSSAPAGSFQAAQDAPYRVLMVCTGNICRSAYAEHVLQDGLDAAAPGEFEIGSAGTLGLPRRPVEPPLDGYLAERGIDSSDFESRRISRGLLDMADAVVVLSGEHRDELLRMSPAALKRTFTLNEMAAAARGLDPEELERLRGRPLRERWAGLLNAAAAAGPRLRRLGGADIEDPFRQKDAVFERVAGEIDEALEALVDFERTTREESRA